VDMQQREKSNACTSVEERTFKRRIGIELSSPSAPAADFRVKRISSRIDTLPSRFYYPFKSRSVISRAGVNQLIPSKGVQ
jgi:hypothetical protein